MISRFSLTCFVGAALVALGLSAVYYSDASAAETPAIASAGIGSAIPPSPTMDEPAPRPSDSIDNPVTDPVAAWDDFQAARKIGWPAAVFAVVTMLMLALGTLGKSVTWLAWLSRGVAATAIGAVSAIGTACYDAVAAGGSWVAIGLAAVMAVAAFWQAQRGPVQPLSEGA